jgi:predicted TIM-barrel fold metal-dependent hydrolase
VATGVEGIMANPSNDEWLISVDDHVIEPPNLWIDRLPAKYRDLGPRWIRDDKGEAWLFGEQDRCPIGGAITCGAVWPPEDRPPPYIPLTWDEIPVACYDPDARVAVMNEDRVLASILFSSLPGFDGNRFSQHPDKELALLCLQAYNDWLLESFCAAHPGRFIGLALVPLWDARLAAAEAERVIRKGARAISFSMEPHNLGFPCIWGADRYWDPLFAVLNEARVPLCTHLGTDFNGDIQSATKAAAKSEAPWVGNIMMQLAGQVTLIEWLNSGNFQRFPNLKLVLSENGIGWIPSVLQIADWLLEMNRSRVTVSTDFENDPLLDEGARMMARTTIQARADAAMNAPWPSELFRQHVYGCFINDNVGLKLIDFIGEDNIMIETDFPHTATWYPHSMDKALSGLAGVDEVLRRKILRGNAERVFQFTPAEPPALVTA